MDNLDYTEGEFIIESKDSFFVIAEELLMYSQACTPSILTTDLNKITDMKQLKHYIEGSKFFWDTMYVELVEFQSICCKLQLRNEYDEAEDV